MRKVWWFILFPALVSGCGAAEGPSRVSSFACTPGATQACACPGGSQGVQTCTDQGDRFGSCSACPAAVHDAGSTPTDTGSAPPDAGSPSLDAGPRPVTDVPSTPEPCSTATSCATCTPRAGCGWCGALNRCVEVNTSCTAPRAGSCASGWACTPTDCADTTSCRSCTQNSDCISNVCGRRSCDGARACAPVRAGAACDSVDGLQCPAVAMWEACTNDTQCGPRMHCVTVYPGQTERQCQSLCASHDDCPAPPAGATAPGVVSFCPSSGSPRTCALACMGAGSCGNGMTCRRSLTGNYAFCL